MGLAMLVQPVPVIEISLAPLEESATDHCSPFSWDNKPSSGPLEESIDYNNEGDEYRPTYLSPPPTHVRFAASPKAVSPLGLNNMTRSKAGDGKGLDADRFEALLKASRERKVTPVVGPKKEDLRKEILSNAHKNKQSTLLHYCISKVVYLYFTDHSGTPSSVLVQASGAPFAFRYISAKDPSRDPIRLSLYTAFSWPCVASRSVRLFEQRHGRRSFFLCALSMG